MHDTKIPLGPYHPLTEEPEQLKIYVKDKKVVDTEFFLGYNHRGIENISENKKYDEVLYIVERICGICSNAHNSAFSKAVERAAGLEATERAKRIRSIVAELERIQSNMLWFGTQSHFLEHDDLFKETMEYREKALDLLEKISGRRLHYGLADFGGVKDDINKETQQKLKKKINKLRERTEEIYKETMSREDYAERLNGVAELSKKRARELGVVGPVARASGLERDARKVNEYDAYPLIDFEVKTKKGCDALARTEVRLEEIIEGTRIIDRLLDLPDQEVKGVDEIEIDEEGRTTAKIEAPRGENFHYLHAGKNRPKRLSIRPPTYANFMAIPEMTIEERIKEAPLAVISIDPCFSCTDRALIVNTETGEEELQDFHDLL